MAELKTGWVIIATSGSTIDGREIKKDWLTDMAKHYNPKVYSCRLWPDHFRYFGPQGKVLALKVEAATDPEFKDEIHLYAILAPTEELVTANRRGHYTHTSIEVFENFANKGFTYLAGLAVTDGPASLGTQELKFTDNPEKGTFTFTGNPLDLSESAINQKKSLLANLLGGKNTHQQEDDAMNEEQFKQFMAAQQAQTAAFTTLTEALTKKPEPAEDEEAEVSVTVEQFTQITASLEDMTQKFTDLETKFAEMIKTPVPGTTADNGQGSATEETL